MKIFKSDQFLNYDGLKIKANPDIHPGVIGLICNLFENKDIRVLILGSGSGAFDQRMLDMGFKNIFSVDINDNNYKISKGKIAFLAIDLNSDFSETINSKFDLIVCLEIIEHVFCPHSFLKNCSELLSKNGRLIITTPNVHDYVSRVHTLLFGYPAFFLQNPDNFGHIVPIYKNHLVYHLSCHGMLIERSYYISSFFKYMRIYTLKTYFFYTILFLTSILLIPFYFFCMNRTFGRTAIFIIMKKH